MEDPIQRSAGAEGSRGIMYSPQLAPHGLFQDIPQIVAPGDDLSVLKQVLLALSSREGGSPMPQILEG